MKVPWYKMDEKPSWNLPYLNLDNIFGNSYQKTSNNIVIQKVCPEEKTEGKFHQNWD